MHSSSFNVRRAASCFARWRRLSWYRRSPARIVESSAGRDRASLTGASTHALHSCIARVHRATSAALTVSAGARRRGCGAFDRRRWRLCTSLHARPRMGVLFRAHSARSVTAHAFWRAAASTSGRPLRAAGKAVRFDSGVIGGIQTVAFLTRAWLGNTGDLAAPRGRPDTVHSLVRTTRVGGLGWLGYDASSNACRTGWSVGVAAPSPSAETALDSSAWGRWTRARSC